MKKLSLVFILLLVLLTLVVFKLSNRNTFINDADILLKILENNSNIITTNQIDAGFKIINLDEENPLQNIQPGNSVHIPFKNLLDKENIKSLKKSNFKIALYSHDEATSIKAYTILNQVGISNLYILRTGDSNSEVFKYKFQPDTTIRPESVIVKVDV